MSTPPQEWRLEIKEGQKDLVSQQYLFKGLQWESKDWQFNSNTATQDSQSTSTFLFDTIYGSTSPEHMELVASQSTFNAEKGTLKGTGFVLKTPNEHWKITAESYQSNYPWSSFQLQHVKGTFER